MKNLSIVSVNISDKPELQDMVYMNSSYDVVDLDTDRDNEGKLLAFSMYLSSPNDTARESSTFIVVDLETARRLQAFLNQIL